MRQRILDAFNKLNEQQKKCIRQNNKRLLVLAGAGTGKTSTLVVRITRHISKDKFKPHEIVALTFTNKAGNEFKKRVNAILSEKFTLNMFLGTFHSFCLKLLRKNHSFANLPQNFQIIDDADKLRLFKSIWRKDLEDKLNIAKAKITKEKINKVIAAEITEEIKDNFKVFKEAIKISIHIIGYAKNRGYDQEWIKDNILEFIGKNDINYEFCDYILHLINEYESEKEKFYLLDFDDLILRTNKMLKEHACLREGIQKQIKALLIDEFQDSNIIQYELMKLLTNDDCLLTVVGDDDQSIYQWRGAILENILEFCSREKGICIKLEENYRSSQCIIKAANDVIDNNKERCGKRLFTQNGVGSPVMQCFYSNAYDEADAVIREILFLERDGVEHKDIAILYRNKSMSGVISNTLYKHNIPSVVYGGSAFWERSEIKDLMAFLKWIDNEGNALSIQRLLNQIKIGYGDKKHLDVNQLAILKKISYGDALREFASEGKSNKLKSALLKIIELKNSAKEIYQQEGLSNAVDFIIKNSGILESYKKGDDKEQFLERIEHMSQIKETASMFSHSEIGEDGELLDDLSVFLSNADLQFEMQSNKANNDKAVSLMTIHAAKGLEYNYVFIIGMEDANFPSILKVLSEDIEEERRLAYVAITRAKKKVYISGAQTRLNKESKQISLFAREISEKHKVFEDKTVFTYF